MPTPDIHITDAGELNLGEALDMTGQPLECGYWSIQIFSHWLELADYCHHKISLNSSEIQYEIDSLFCKESQ